MVLVLVANVRHGNLQLALAQGEGANPGYLSRDLHAIESI
jgi:hypothetical protein